MLGLAVRRLRTRRWGLRLGRFAAGGIAEMAGDYRPTGGFHCPAGGLPGAEGEEWAARP